MTDKENSRIRLSEQERDFIQALILNNKNLITYTVRRCLGDVFGHLLEDVLSETYLVACENIQTLLKHENPDGWIVLTAKNTALRFIKSCRKTVFDVPFETITNNQDNTDTAEDAVFNIWERENVSKKILSSLTKRERQVYQKIYMERKSANIVAEEMGISRSTVWSLHKTLRDKICHIVENKKF